MRFGNFGWTFRRIRYLGKRSRTGTPRTRRLAAEPLEDRRMLALLGVDPLLPYIDYNSTGRAVYAASDNAFTVDAMPISYNYFSLTDFEFQHPLILDSDVRISIRVNNEGALIGGDAGDDLVVSGTIDLDENGVADLEEPTGILLTGEILAFGYQDGTTTDHFDFRFRPTGGVLASDYDGKDIGVVLASEYPVLNPPLPHPAFAGSFEADFSGGAKGVIGPVDPLPGSIGDFVWVDTNGNGLQDGGEPGLENVTVTLTGTDGAGNAVNLTTTTDASGFYLFDNLVPGTYTVTFTKPDGYQFTAWDADGAGIAGEFNSDAQPVSGATAAVTLQSGQSILTIDAGLVPPSGGGGGEIEVAIEVKKYVRVTREAQPGGLEGLTPGFWKTHSQYGPAPLAGWPQTDYGPDDSWEGVFKVDVPGSPTLLEALNTGGGGINALLRHSTAALLNASHPNIDYAYTVDEVIDLTAAAIDSQDAAVIEAVKNVFDWENNRGADLSSGGSSGTATTEFEDADDPTGPHAAAGDTVTFMIVVRNMGDTPLEVVVVDDRGTDDTSDDLRLIFSDFSGDDGNGLLDEGEEWTYLYSILAEDPGQFVNRVTATAVAVQTPSGIVVTDDDPAHWLVLGDGNGQQTGEQGLTAGFWRQSHHLTYWQGYGWGEWYNEVFGVSLNKDVTLLDALRAKGGGVNALLRQSVAALLNASHAGIDYAFTTDQVIQMVQDAFASGDYETIKDIFERENERGGIDLKVL